jgi:hypothetical protein
MLVAGITSVTEDYKSVGNKTPLYNVEIKAKENL